MLTDRLKVKDNYILEAKNNGKFIFDTIIQKKTKDMGKYEKKY